MLQVHLMLVKTDLAEVIMMVEATQIIAKAMEVVEDLEAANQEDLKTG